MTIYLTQGDSDGARADEIEGRLKPAIPDLKRVSRVEDIDPKIINGAERPIIVLIAAPREHRAIDDLIAEFRLYPQNLFFIVVGGDISAHDPAPPTGSPRPDRRRKFSRLSDAPARR